MIKIINIKKCGKDKYEIELDNNIKIKTYDEVILNNNLLFKKSLSEELINKIEEENKGLDNYYKVINFISRKMRCKKEINDFLDNLNVNNNEKVIILSKLEKNKLINDKEYARAYVQDKMLLSSDGPNKIKNDLQANNISNDIIDNCMLEIDESDIFNKLVKLITKKINTNSNKSEYALKQKIIYDMKILGYDEYMINDVLDNISIKPNDDIINKEYNKLYNKLHSKYSGKELDYNIYCKLRQKGFTDSDINKVKKLPN